MALVFPFAMLTRMMSAGAVGGGVSPAVSRALGALDSGRANTLAVYALVIGAAVGVVYTLIFIVCGATSYRMTGGTSGVLAQATSYSTVLFSGALLVWLSNTLGAVLSGAGNMRVPLMASAMTAILQIGLDGVLGLGLGLGPIQSYVLAPTLGPAQRNVGAVAHLMVDANIRVPSPPPGGF